MSELKKSEKEEQEKKCEEEIAYKFHIREWSDKELEIAERLKNEHGYYLCKIWGCQSYVVYRNNNSGAYTRHDEVMYSRNLKDIEAILKKVDQPKRFKQIPEKEICKFKGIKCRHILIAASDDCDGHDVNCTFYSVNRLPPPARTVISGGLKSVDECGGKGLTTHGIIGACSKHPEQSMINCPRCAIEQMKPISGDAKKALEHAIKKSGKDIPERERQHEEKSCNPFASNPPIFNTVKFCNKYKCVECPINIHNTTKNKGNLIVSTDENGRDISVNEAIDIILGKETTDIENQIEEGYRQYQLQTIGIDISEKCAFFAGAKSKEAYNYHKPTFYKKLHAKLLKIKNSEMSLDQYIIEIENKLKNKS